MKAIPSAFPLALAAACMLHSAPVLPQLTGSVYVFAFPASGPRLEIDPGTGARLSSLKLGGHEFLYLDKTQINWGSTLWPSPQSVWGWPPPEALDRARYMGGPQGASLVLVGAKDNATQLSFAKRISAEDGDTSITQTYIIRNGSTAAKTVAPWQVTRVPPGGIAFHPKGAGGGRGNMASQVKEISGWMWFDFDASALPSGPPKYFADGAGGWMAAVDRNGLLLLEVFPDIPAAQAAPDEAEVEIYADPNKKYMEIEHQGAYASIKAGDSVAWTTRWYLRKVPEGIDRKPGNPALMAFVNDLVRGASTPAGIGGNAPASPSGNPAGPAFRAADRNFRLRDAIGRAVKD